MVKTLQHNTSYKGGDKGISAMENALLSALSRSGLIVFGVQEALRLTRFGRTAVHNLLASLAGKGILVRLLRGKYCLKEAMPENRFAIATGVFVPSYVSFWSALSFYGFTEQLVEVVQLASAKQFRKLELGEIKIQPITIRQRLFFGYVEENGAAIASKEKALVDSALNFENAGGFSEFAKCLRNAWEELNKGLFVEYLLKTNNKSLNSRIGYLIEELKLPLGKDLRGRINAKSSKGFVKLNPKKRKLGRYNKKWGIIINDSVKGGGII